VVVRTEFEAEFIKPLAIFDAVTDVIPFVVVTIIDCRELLAEFNVVKTTKLDGLPVP
jgi:hypothetical protein